MRMLSTFSLDAVPESDRASALEASFAGYLLPISTRFVQQGTVSARFAAGSVGRARLERFDVRGASGTAVRAVTSSDSAVEPTITMHALDRGDLAIRHAGRISRVRPGSMLLSSTDSPLAMTQRFESAMSTITIPVADARLSRAATLVSLNRPFADTDPVAATALSLLRRLTRSITDAPDQPWEVLEGTLVALIRALVLIGASSARDARGPLSETLGERVLHHIDEHALDPGIDAAGIAAAHGISTRYLYVILRGLDISLGEHVRSIRLSYAAQLLRDPSCSGLSIAEIAYRSGFADHAHFSRTFRQRNQASPSEWRRAATERAQPED
jgi:AraC-like DNA-binding protein